ncbi:transport and Golgi organization protein 2 [Teratosphaeria destructans]|uniref:Transport and Golgi organization protein 2 n=1 Tax=Teratosphaeria destructans TaxID=418781 RepID=A0A9W7SIS6_9PEZI|nr:transport and Golgi organization protein 2 [Teratosphaeria destructans]
MCITVLSTAHPEYPFVLINNRDEFLDRRTAKADWWDSPHENVLGGRDLQRAERGTWLAITTDGRIANLTNFRDEGVDVARGKSRGGLTNAFLKQPYDRDEDFVKRLIDGVGIHDVGGFTLLFGRLRKPQDGTVPGLATISNRTSSADGIVRIATKPGETHGLSNSHFGDMSWQKVVHGEQFLRQAIRADADRGSDQDRLIESLFDVLSVDTLPRPNPDQPWPEYTRQLRNSILIPPVGGEDMQSKPADKLAAADGTATPDHGRVRVGEGVYGTHQQTVILVRKDGRVTFVERTLYDGDARPMAKEESESRFQFDIEGWESA